MVLPGSRFPSHPRSYFSHQAVREFFGSHLCYLQGTTGRNQVGLLATSNRVGFKIFQFIDPSFKAKAVDFEYNRGGLFHICITDPDPDAVADRVVREGGRRQGITVKVTNGAATCAYVKDPWGNVF